MQGKHVCARLARCYEPATMIANGTVGNGSERMDGAEEEGAAIVPRVVEGVRRADEQFVSLVRERPVASLCAAALMGYLIGRVLTRLS